jgi:hypothetical protein
MTSAGSGACRVAQSTGNPWGGAGDTLTDPDDAEQIVRLTHNPAVF